MPDIPCRRSQRYRAGCNSRATGHSRRELQNIEVLTGVGWLIFRRCGKFVKPKCPELRNLPQMRKISQTNCLWSFGSYARTPDIAQISKCWRESGGAFAADADFAPPIHRKTVAWSVPSNAGGSRGGETKSADAVLVSSRRELPDIEVLAGVGR